MDLMNRARELAEMMPADCRPTVDPAGLQPPAVLIVPPHTIYTAMASGLVEWHFYACGPGSPGLDSYQAMERLRQQLETVFPLEESTPRLLPPITGLAGVPAIDCIYREELS